MNKVLLALCLTFSVSACSGNTEPTDNYCIKLGSIAGSVQELRQLTQFGNSEDLLNFTTKNKQLQDAGLEHLQLMAELAFAYPEHYSSYLVNKLVTEQCGIYYE